MQLKKLEIPMMIGGVSDSPNPFDAWMCGRDAFEFSQNAKLGSLVSKLSELPSKKQKKKKKEDDDRRCFQNWKGLVPKGERFLVFLTTAEKVNAPELLSWNLSDFSGRNECHQKTW
jgi:hypothetical protein